MSANSELIHEWFECYQNINHIYDKLNDIYLLSPESNISACMYNTFKLYTNFLSEKLGDEDGWLEWYIYDNDCGRRGFAAKASNWKKYKKIKNLKDLENLIIACQRKKD